MSEHHDICNVYNIVGTSRIGDQITEFMYRCQVPLED